MSTGDDLTVSIKRVMKFLPPLSPLGPVDYVVRRLVNSRRIRAPMGWGDHKRAWTQIEKSLDTNNPEYALMAAWSILEGEVKRKGNSNLAKIGVGRQLSIVECTSDSLSLSKCEGKLLKKASAQRTDSAHSLERGNGKTTWNTVSFVLRCANQLHTS
jgi:hypothetical protein